MIGRIGLKKGDDKMGIVKRIIVFPYFFLGILFLGYCCIFGGEQYREKTLLRLSNFIDWYDAL